MTEMEEWRLRQLTKKTETDIKLAEQMAADSVNILQATPHLTSEEGVMGWTILFEYHFQGLTANLGGGWRKYVVEWPGNVPGLDASLVAGVQYCYTLAKELRTKLGQGE